MDDHVKTLLRHWQLEELIPKFEDEEVNEKAFKCLTEDIIRELIPKLGKRAIFNSAYKLYREALDRDNGTLEFTVAAQKDLSVSPVKLEPTSSEAISKEAKITNQDEFLDSVKTERIVALIRSPTDDVANADNVRISEKYRSEAEPSRISFSICALENPSEEDRCTADTLRLVLSSSEKTNHLLGKTFLTRSCRNALAEVIVRYLYVQNDGVLSSRLLKSWSRAVELVFHNEICNLYYRETKSGSCFRGKLIEYYENLRNIKSAMRNP